jgi:hypothetical protein
MEKGLAEVSEDNPTEPRNDQEVADPFWENQSKLIIRDRKNEFLTLG